MNCPNCHHVLIPGEAYFRKNLSDLVTFGLGSEDLRMTSDRGEEFLLLTASEKTAAQFCRECGVVIIATEKGQRPALRRAD